MILHRRIHKLRKDRFEEALTIALQFNELGATKLKKRAMVYQPAMAGAALSRNHIVIDTLHESLAQMEQYFQDFGQLPEVKPLLARWNEVEEESWAENYVVVEHA